MSRPSMQSWHTLSRTLPDGERFYVLGDIQGCSTLLADILERIGVDRRLRPTRRATLIYLGDYVGLGPNSFKTMELALTAPRWADEVIHLIGDQDRSLLGALTGAPSSKAFLDGNGLQILKSFSVGGETRSLRMAAQGTIIESARSKCTEQHRQMLDSASDRFVYSNFFFCHAGVRPGQPLGKQTTLDLTTITEPFLSSSADFGALIVHGHAPVVSPEVRRNRVNLNTDAAKTGRLTCGVFELDRVKFITTGASADPGSMKHHRPGGPV